MSGHARAIIIFAAVFLVARTSANIDSAGAGENTRAAAVDTVSLQPDERSPEDSSARTPLSIDTVTSSPVTTVDTLEKAPVEVDSSGDGVTPQPAGGLSVVTVPDSALIIFDGKPAGTTPATLEGLAPGLHKIQLYRKGYYTKNATVRISAGQRQQVTFDLIQPCRLHVISVPESCIVFIGGTEAGVTPFVKDTLKPDTYAIRLVHPAYQPVDTAITLASGADDTLYVSLVHTREYLDSAQAALDAGRKQTGRVKSIVSLSVFVLFALVVMIVELAQ